MNAAREASDVVCSHINFTYPHLPPQPTGTYNVCIKNNHNTYQSAEKLIHVLPTQYNSLCHLLDLSCK